MFVSSSALLYFVSRRVLVVAIFSSWISRKLLQCSFKSRMHKTCLVTVLLFICVDEAFRKILPAFHSPHRCTSGSQEIKPTLSFICFSPSLLCCRSVPSPLLQRLNWPALQLVCMQKLTRVQSTHGDDARRRSRRNSCFLDWPSFRRQRLKCFGLLRCEQKCDLEFFLSELWDRVHTGNPFVRTQEESRERGLSAPRQVTDGRKWLIVFCT